MSKNLFKKAAVMTDLHMGLKSNSKQHNEDCINYLQWFIETAHINNCDMCLFLGDYFHNRNNINLLTMNYGIQGMRLLSNAFEHTIMIPGNHDNYYRDMRSINSITWAEHIPNIKILNEITSIGDCIFVPWMIPSEEKELFAQRGTYVFGHFELPNFMMNAMVKMPDVGNLKSENFSIYKEVYTGHFHKRQTQKNITYIGNAFPHNFSDVDDDERGCMILEWGESPVYYQWPKAPKYRIVKLSDLISNPSYFLPSNSYIKLLLDTFVSFEEATYLKENLVHDYNLRELNLISLKKNLHMDSIQSSINEAEIKTVDDIVQNHLVNSIESDYYDNSLLLDIYRSLD